MVIHHKGWSVRSRLTLWNVSVLALVLLVLGVTLRSLAFDQALASLDRELEYRARNLSGSWAAEIESPSNPAARAAAASDPGRPRAIVHFDSSSLRVFDSEGRALVHGVRTRPWDMAAFRAALHGTEGYSTVRQEDDAVRVYTAALRNRGEVVGVVEAAEPLSQAERGMAGLSSALLMLTPLALLVAGFGGAFLADRALGPVRQVARTAEQIGASNLSDRLEVHGDDEFSHLADTINGMLERLEDAFDRQAEAIDQQRRFTADASHELRTPLTVIKANTSLALSCDRTAEEYRAALKAADRAAGQMNRVVQDLLLLARSDAGELNLRLRPVPIANVLESVRESFAGVGGATIHLGLPARPVCVSGDESHLVRLFTNLVENAIRHGGDSGPITLGVSPGQGSVSVKVEDSGPGIGPSDLPYVCERFYRGDSSRSRSDGGSGLGLPICLSIAAAHEGSLAIESEEGRGTTVTVTLPLAARTVGARRPRTDSAKTTIAA